MSVSTKQPRFEKKATRSSNYWRSTLPVGPLREYLRSLDLTFFKQASIGGEQEQGFEQAFSSLAYAYLKDKAPRLIDYLVGFQLVERNEDNTKAMGLFGAKVGDQWLYAPVFFLNGDLKGHELCYVKKQDNFVPMKENWINFLISRKPHVLGEASPRDTYQLGGIPPDVYRMTHPPTSGKYGSDAYRPEVQDWAAPFLSFIGAVATKSEKLFTKSAGVEKNLDLRGFLGSDLSLLHGAFELTQKYPLLKTGFEKFYGKNFFLDTARDMQARNNSLLNKQGASSCAPMKKPKTRRNGSLIPDEPAVEHPLKTGSLKILVHQAWDTINQVAPTLKQASSLLTDSDIERVEGLLKQAALVDEEAPGGIVQNKDVPTQEEQEKLLREGVVISDSRDESEKSTVYNTQVKLELTNPGETGIFEVLEKPGSFDDMLVVSHPHTNRGRELFCTVVRLSDPKNWLNIHSSNLWVQASPEPSRPDFKKWFDDLSATTELTKDSWYLAIGPNGVGTTPFQVQQVYGDGAYSVDFNDYAAFGKDRPTWARRGPDYYDYIGSGDYVSTYNAKIFINKNEGSSLRSVSGELSIPANFKIFKLKDAAKPKKDDGDSLIRCCKPVSLDAGSEEKPIQPGNLADIQLMIHEKTARLKILDWGNEVWIDAKGHNERMSKKAALISLVRDHGTSEADARHMLKVAATKGQATFRIKYADQFAGPNSNSMLEGGPNTPGFPQPYTGIERMGYNAVPSIYPQEMLQAIPEMSSSRTDPTIYDPFYQPDQQAMQMAQEASNSGQKEVFDTAMISGMLKAVRQDSIVDRYLGDLIKALDKLGRILFMFYWHQEEFEDRYGKQDLPEMEDSLRNAFEVLGDVCLYLQKKQVGGGMNAIGSLAGNSDSEPSIEEAARN